MSLYGGSLEGFTVTRKYPNTTLIKADTDAGRTLRIDNCRIVGDTLTFGGDGALGVVCGSDGNIILSNTTIESVNYALFPEGFGSSACIVLQDCRFISTDGCYLDAAEFRAVRSSFINQYDPGTGVAILGGNVDDVLQCIVDNFGTVFSGSGSCPGDSAYYNIFNGYSTLGCSINGSNNLLATDPLFCEEREPSVETYSLRIDSPAIAANNSWNKDIGSTDGAECAWGSLARNATVSEDIEIIVLEDLTVPSGKTLTLKEGSALLLDDYDNSESGLFSYQIFQQIDVNGVLRVEGASNNKVRFETVNPDTEWVSLFINSGGKAFIDNAEFHNAEYAVVPSTSDSISVTNSLFSDNEDVAIHLFGSPAYALISGNTFEVEEELSEGIKVESSNQSNITISNNTFEGTASSDVGLNFNSGSGSAVVSGNTFEGFDNAAGVFVAAASPILKNNIFDGNKAGVEVVGGFPNIGVDTDSTSDNVFKSNTSGVHVHCTTSGTCPTPPSCPSFTAYLRNNRIYENTYGVLVKKTANANLGTVLSYGYNRFWSNSSYCINNSSSCGTVSAMGNWFGECTGGYPTSCWNGSVTTTNALCTEPSGGVEVGVDVVSGSPSFTLRGAWPNPMNAATTFLFAVGLDPIEMTGEIFDVSGRTVRTFPQKRYGPGLQELFWDGNDERGGPVANGIYFVRIRDDKGVQKMKVLVAR